MSLQRGVWDATQSTMSNAQ